MIWHLSRLIPEAPGKKHGVAKLPPHRALVARVVTPVVMDVATADAIQRAVDAMDIAQVVAVLDVTHHAKAVAMVVVTLLVTQVVLVNVWDAPLDAKLHAQHDALDAVVHAQAHVLVAMVALVVVQVVDQDATDALDVVQVVDQDATDALDVVQAVDHRAKVVEVTVMGNAAGAAKAVVMDAAAAPIIVVVLVVITVVEVRVVPVVAIITVVLTVQIVPVVAVMAPALEAVAVIVDRDAEDVAVNAPVVLVVVVHLQLVVHHRELRADHLVLLEVHPVPPAVLNQRVHNVVPII
jgi:hypothetical protein